MDMNDEELTNFEGRRAEVRADYEDRLVTASEYHATLARIDQDEDEYFRRRAAGEEPEAAPATADGDTTRPAAG
jgi:hypothetical protein